MKYFLILPLFLGLVCCKNQQIETHSSTYHPENKKDKKEWNGVNLVAISSPIDSSNITPIVNLHANSVAIIPFGFIRSGQANVEYNLKWQWHGEKKIGAIEQIKLAHKQHLKVLLKPHIWVHDSWVGDLEFSNETDWKIFEKTYLEFILDYALLADSMNVEAFCLGVELKKITSRLSFWNSFIDSVRNVYKGKITYAANWDNYDKVDFWNKLDYIGVDAYFPLSEKKTPTVQEFSDGWQNHLVDLKKKSTELNKPVIFTEFGFRSMDYNGKEPWYTGGSSTNNLLAQNNAYQAIFQEVWSQDWFAGGFLWKWYPNHSNAGGKENNRFTPQNKPVEKRIRTQYLKSK